VPEFRYESPDAGWALSRQVPSLAALAAWLVFACWFALRSVRRLRVDATQA
jgi:hypothetical protein